MPKLNIESVPPVLKKFIDATDVVSNITKELNKLIQREKEERDANRTPKKKNQYVVLVSDPEGKIPAGTELVAWVTQIKEDEDSGSILSKIINAIRNFNQSKKGRKNPADSIGDGIDAAQRKFFKEENIDIKTKMPVRVMITDNKIPTS